jgi:membrane-bound metal-dependent hydrolase YbcI (DUF457 family)
MDNVTHTLFALTLARTRLARAGRGTTTALVLASNAPDIDIVTTGGGAVSYLHWHRGPTHGVVGVLVLGLITAGLVWTGRRYLDRRRLESPASFSRLAMVSILGVLLHVLMDLATSYGTRPLVPFDWHWYAEDWLPIVDIYLLAALAAGLVFGHGSDAMRRHNLMIVMTLMLMDYGARAVAHHEALSLAPRVFGPTLPLPCEGAASPRAVVDRWPHALAPEAGKASRRCLVDLAAIPDILSPFRWHLIAQTSNSYEVFDVDLLDSRYRRPPGGTEVLWRHAMRYPNVWTSAVFAAAAATDARVFLGFSRFPLVRTFADPQGIVTVTWTDMRFAPLRDQPPGIGRGGAGRSAIPGGVVNPGNAITPGDLFSVSVRVSPDGQVLDEAFGR